MALCVKDAAETRFAAAANSDAALELAVTALALGPGG